MAITAAMVRELRERSGAGMMECKKALEATAGEMEQAFDHLRKAGLKAADKKAGREMSEGRVLALIADDHKSGALVALTTETDFVVKSEAVERLLNELAQHVLAHETKSVEELLAQPWKDGGSVEEAVKGVSGKSGENMQVLGVAYFANPEGRVGAYVHHTLRVGVMASITSPAGPEATDAFLDMVCKHAAAYQPAVLSRGDVPAATLEREKAIYLEEVKGKPAEMQEKIVGGKLEKYFASQALVEQPWIQDDKVSVQKALEKALGAGSKIVAFAQFRIGQ